MEFLSLMTPSTGMVISISTQPSGTQLQDSSYFQRPDSPQLPFYARLLLNGADAIRKVRARRWGVQYEYMFLESNAQDLDALSGYVEDRKLVPVVGLRANLRDIEKVKEACQSVYRGKGSIGKAVIEVI